MMHHPGILGLIMLKQVHLNGYFIPYLKKVSWGMTHGNGRMEKIMVGPIIGEV